MMSRASEVNAHTLYAYYTRLQEKAVADMLRLRPVLFPEEQAPVESIGQYLVPVVFHRAPLQQQIERGDGSQNEIAGLLRQLEDSVRAYDKAVVAYRESVMCLNQLEQDNAVFSAPDQQRNDYHHVLDQETCSCAAANASGVSLDGHCFFSGKFIELTDQQTDAVRVSCAKAELHSLNILDQRDDNQVQHDAPHGAAIRLLAPSPYKITDIDDQQHVVKQLDSLSGSLLQDVTIQDCDIRAECCSLQGIFSSNGLYRKLKITGNTVETKGIHAIAIAGALDGCEFRDNTLRQVVGGATPSISLYPASIGANLADDGVLNILSFKDGSELSYGEVFDAGNRLYHNGEITVLKVQDFRHAVNPQSLDFAAGLINFDYQAYRMQYTGWKLRDFQARDSVGYTRLRDWLELREDEYRSGGRVDDRLPKPNTEQCRLGENTIIDQLAQAREAVARNDAEFRALRLTDLPYPLIRSFIIKRIALRNAELAPLLDLGERKNNRRRANLEFILPARAFTPRVDHDGWYPMSRGAAMDKAKTDTDAVAAGIV